MTGPGAKAMRNARKALASMGLEYAERDGTLVVRTMGDDLPIGMAIIADDGNMTLNFYCYLMFDVPADARRGLLQELNTLNNTINNGGFYMADDENKIYFKMVQSYFDQVPSARTVAHLVTVALKTVDVNDGNLKGLIPASALRKDPMYSRGVGWAEGTTWHPAGSPAATGTGRCSRPASRWGRCTTSSSARRSASAR